MHKIITVKPPHYNWLTIYYHYCKVYLFVLLTQHKTHSAPSRGDPLLTSLSLLATGLLVLLALGAHTGKQLESGDNLPRGKTYVLALALTGSAYAKFGLIAAVYVFGLTVLLFYAGYFAIRRVQMRSGHPLPDNPIRD